MQALVEPALWLLLAGEQLARGMICMALTRDAILKIDDIKTEEVEIEEWGGSVLVRGLTGRQRDDFEGSILEMRGKRMVPNVANIRAKLTVRCVVDEAGKRLFTDAEADKVGEKSAAAIDKIYDVAARLSGLSDADVEEMVADFDPSKAPSVDSPSS
jgi:hypothetical protein